MELPQWLDEYLIDSGPGAYENLEPHLRAELKSQIALLHRYYGEQEGFISHDRDWLGRYLRNASAPKDWALFVLDKNYASPSGLLAAIMPSVLAGVEDILVCLIDEAFESGSNNFELALPVSAALELVGVEQVWAVSQPWLDELLACLRQQSGTAGGTVIALGDSLAVENNSELALEVLRQGFSCNFFPGQVHIGIQPDCLMNTELLRWAQPQAEIINLTSDLPEAVCNLHAVFEGTQDSFAGFAQYAVGSALFIQPGNEAFWVWPDLTLNLFRKQTACIFNC